MSKALVVFGSIFGLGIFLVVVLAMYFVSSYNSMVTQNESINQSWAQVENQYQRRADLIPNLVSTVKGYANFEKQTLTDVVEARAKVGQMTLTKEMLNDPASLQKFQSVQGELSSALSRLMVVVEKYPDLKANQNFLQLQAQLEGTENRISVERRKFNIDVQSYNTTIKRFPKNILAGMFGFKDRPYFEADKGTEKAPKVEFN